MNDGFYSLRSLLESLMWSEGPPAWEVMDAIESEENQ